MHWRVIPVFQSDTPLAWGDLDLPMVAVPRDWHGRAADPPPAYALADDGTALWFVAHHRAPAVPHPSARPGVFTPQLWEYDVAEMFLADPASGRYLEFNLAPNAAWWNCEFTGPRQPAEPTAIAMPGVQSWADLAADGSWVAAMALPLDMLRARIGYGPQTYANITFILGTPGQRFFSAAPLPGVAPDFHQPQAFQPLATHPLASLRHT